MRHLLLILLGFGLIGCDYNNIKKDDLNFSCICIKEKSTNELCTYDEAPLVINKESKLLDFYNMTFINLIETPTYLKIEEANNSFSFNRATLELTHKWGRNISGERIKETYQCNEVKI